MGTFTLIFIISLFLLSLYQDNLLFDILKKIFNTDFLNFYRRIIILLIIYSSSRFLFYIVNIDAFKDNLILSMLEGIRFDISALIYINIPVLILMIFPSDIRQNIHYKQLTNIIFYLSNIPFIIINNVDIEYYKFSFKRTTSDFFEYMTVGGGVDISTIIPQYIVDYWIVTLISIVQIFILIKINHNKSFVIKSYSKSIIIFVMSITLFIIGARGGIQLKPINIIDAGSLTNNEDNRILILNTPFCILQTLSEKDVKQYHYFSEEEMNLIYKTNHHFSDNIFNKKNIVIIILESYSKEFVNNKNTPFLLEIMQHSLVMNNAYANGIRSIEAMPAITASIPALMDNAFITSSYAMNSYIGLPKLLNNEGYSSSFFHGGKKGTMGFFQFSRRSGFQNYFGMEEYNNNDDYDGCWGIYDKPFFNFYANYLNNETEPFISSIFSVTSHPPYSLPNKYEKSIEKGNLEIHQTIKYTDLALKEFFTKVKKEKWFKNTLFVITADHTSPESEINAYHKVNRYSIPLIYFAGDTSIKGTNENITQQIDVMPTILDIIGYNKPFFCFGKSAINEDSWAIRYINNEYLLIHNDGYLLSIGEKYNNFSDIDLEKKNSINQDKVNLLKAIKQKYGYSLLRNKMKIDENKVYH